MRIAVAHLTRLDFVDEVTESIMDVHLGPRDDADQSVRRFQLKVEPPGHVRQYDDGFGNAAHQLTARRAHTFLQVSAESEVHTQLVDPFRVPEQVPRPLDPIERADALFPSPLVPRVRAVEDLAGSFRGLEPFAAVRDMTEMVYREFAYRAGVTDVTTSIEYVVHARQGVCQDFAHILIGLCRALDIPARYVSGYVFGSHAHPPNRGDGASHAWVEAFTPTHGWRGFDPTNNLMANDHYIKIAIGRDYRDVAPTRGTYRGAATEHMTVEVATRELD